MNAEQLTVSLETARKLKEAGWDGETHFRFSRDCYNQVVLQSGGSGMLEGNICAPTTNELLDALPTTILTEHNKGWITLSRGEIGHFNAGYYMSLDEWVGEKFTRETPQDALASLWLWAKKEGLV